MIDFQNKWIFIGSLGMVFIFTLIFSYGPGYGGQLLSFFGNNVTSYSKVSPSDLVTPVVTVKKMVTLKSVTNVTSVSPSVSPSVFNDYKVSIYSQSPTTSPRLSVSPSVSPSVSTMSPTPRVSPSVSPVTPTPVVTLTPSPEASAETESPTTTPEPETLTPTPSPTPTPIVINFGDVVINEIGWMGTKASSNHEWIELYNTTGQTISLEGWSLKTGDGTLSIPLSGSISPSGFYILERGPITTTTIRGVIADLRYGNFGSAWSLNNNGEKLELYDFEGKPQDSINGSNKWFTKGVASPDYKSMERIDSKKLGDDSTNWGTNDGSTINGQDTEGNPINGTPGTLNSTATL